MVVVRPVVAVVAVVVGVVASVVGDVATEAVVAPAQAATSRVSAAKRALAFTVRGYTRSSRDPVPWRTPIEVPMSKQYAKPPEITIDLAKTHTATVHTNHGDIEIEFFAEEAPQTVNNFVFLAGEGFFDGVIFHRVVPGFVIQAGDPTGTGRGGPGYRFRDELDHPRPYARGTVAMANAGPNTNGSQFFICLQDVGLPHAYTIFGKVTKGMDAVDAIAATPLRGERPVEDAFIRSCSISVE